MKSTPLLSAIKAFLFVTGIVSVWGNLISVLGFRLLEFQGVPNADLYYTIQTSTVYNVIYASTTLPLEILIGYLSAKYSHGKPITAAIYSAIFIYIHIIISMLYPFPNYFPLWVYILSFSAPIPLCILGAKLCK